MRCSLPSERILESGAVKLKQTQQSELNAEWTMINRKRMTMSLQIGTLSFNNYFPFICNPAFDLGTNPRW